MLTISNSNTVLCYMKQSIKQNHRTFHVDQSIKITRTSVWSHETRIKPKNYYLIHTNSRHFPLEPLDHRGGAPDLRPEAKRRPPIRTVPPRSARSEPRSLPNTIRLGVTARSRSDQRGRSEGFGDRRSSGGGAEEEGGGGAEEAKGGSFIHDEGVASKRMGEDYYCHGAE